MPPEHPQGDGMMPNDEPRLYVLMRTDAPYSSPGKSMAQATHAANQCVYEARAFGAIFDIEGDIAEWEAQTGAGFGTTIVLGVTEQEMRDRVGAATVAGVHAGIVHDPTYPSAVVDTFNLPLYLGFSAVLAITTMAHGSLSYALFFACMGTMIWILHLSDKVRRSLAPATIPLDTCGFVFGRKSQIGDLLAGLKLHR